MKHLCKEMPGQEKKKSEDSNEFLSPQDILTQEMMHQRLSTSCQPKE